MTDRRFTGRGYVDRLRLAADIRLIDDAAKWPALARRVDEVTAELPRAALSAEELLLHAAARALGGEPERHAVAITPALAITEQDVPFICIVLARNGIATLDAQQVYQRALQGALSPVLDESLRLAFERGFRPDEAAQLGDAFKALLASRGWQSAWQQSLRALAGDDRELVELALGDAPQLLVGAEQRIAKLLIANGRWRELVTQAAIESRGRDPAVSRGRVQLLRSTTAWRVPLPLATVCAILDQPGAAEVPDATTLLALASGDLEAIRRGGDPMAADTDEVALARGIAVLGGSAADVRDLWLRLAAAPPAPGEPSTRIVLAALFAIELDQRSTLRELARVLDRWHDAAWTKPLLARIYLAVGEPEQVDAVLGDDEGPVIELLKARGLAESDRRAAVPLLRTLVEAHRGWSEARLQLGLALAKVDPVEALVSLETPPVPGADSAALGAPCTAQAAALLAAGELRRRERRDDLASQRINAALARAPGSPLVARQALILATALRSSELVARCHEHLRYVAPGASPPPGSAR